MGLDDFRDEYNVDVEKTAIELLLSFCYFSSVRSRFGFKTTKNVKQKFFLICFLCFMRLLDVRFILSVSS